MFRWSIDNLENKLKYIFNNFKENINLLCHIYQNVIHEMDNQMFFPMDYNEQVLSNVDKQLKIYKQFHLSLYIQLIYVNLHDKYNPKIIKIFFFFDFLFVLGLYRT